MHSRVLPGRVYLGCGCGQMHGACCHVAGATPSLIDLPAPPSLCVSGFWLWTADQLLNINTCMDSVPDLDQTLYDFIDYWHGANTAV